MLGQCCHTAVFSVLLALLYDVLDLLHKLQRSLPFFTTLFKIQQFGSVPNDPKLFEVTC